MLGNINSHWAFRFLKSNSDRCDRIKVIYFYRCLCFLRISNLDDNAINPITRNSQRYSRMTRRMFASFPNCIVILSHCTCRSQKNGAGDGNRTHVIGLGSRRSAIELHPRKTLNNRGWYSTLVCYQAYYTASWAECQHKKQSITHRTHERVSFFSSGFPFFVLTCAYFRYIISMKRAKSTYLFSNF